MSFFVFCVIIKDRTQILGNGGIILDQQQLKLKKMTEEPVEKLICKLAVPTIISMLITSLYNMADSYFVSKIETTAGDSSSAVGAVGVVFAYMSIIQALGFLFGQGSGNYVSRALGSRRFDDAEIMVASGFVAAFLMGSVVLVIGFLFSDSLVTLLGATETIKPYAIDYLRIISLGAPFMCSSLVMNNQLRFQGSAVYAMVGITTGGILNAILDPIFIFTFNMGISGAAAATALSQFVSFVLLIIGTTKGSNIRIKFNRVSKKISTYKEIFINGMPSLARQGLASFSTICLNHAAVPFGDAAIAAMSIVSRINMFANSAVIGFGQGFQPVCGFNYGARLYKRVSKAYWFCVRTAVIFLAVVSVIMYFNAPSIIRIFGKEDHLTWEIGAAALRYQCFVMPLSGLVVLSNMLLQTIRKPIRATILAMARQGIVFIPTVLILSSVLGLTGIELSQPCSDAISFVMALIIALPVVRSLK